MSTFSIVPILVYFCSFVVEVNSYKSVCVCMRDNGDIMLLKSTGSHPSSSSSTQSEYSFPEMESPTGCVDHKYVLENMRYLGINGVVSRALYYTSSVDRANGTRDKFFRIYVPPNNINILPANKEWRNLAETHGILKNHPNENYKLFLAYALINPNILNLININGVYKPKVFDILVNKKITLMCTDAEGKVLFVRSGLGIHALPGQWLRFKLNQINSHINHSNSLGKAAAERMIFGYGLIGCIYGKCSCKGGFENGCRNIETVFHVLVMKQALSGITNPNVPEAEGAFAENLAYDPNCRYWLPPNAVKNVLAGTQYLKIYERIYASRREWPAVFDKLQAKYLQFRQEGNPEPTYIEMNCILDDDSDDESAMDIIL